MAQAPEGVKAKVQKRLVPPSYKPPDKAAQKDTKSNADRNRARTYERTPAYRGAVRQTYNEQPTKQRSIIAHHATGAPLSAVAKLHMDRLGRNQELRQSQATKDTKGNQDYYRGRAADRVERSHTELVNLANEIIQAHKNTPLPGVTGDTKTGLERVAGEAYKLTPKYESDFNASAKAGDQLKTERAAKAEDKKYSGFGGAGLAVIGLATGSGPLYKGALSAGNALGDYIKTMPMADALQQPGTILGDSGVGKAVVNTTANFGKELVNLPANVVPSVYHVLEPTVAGRLANPADPNSAQMQQGLLESGKRIVTPYKNLVSPKGWENNPLTNALMLGGGLKGADRVAGRVEQRAVPMMKPRRPYPLIQEKLPGTAAANIVLPRQGAVAHRLQVRSHKNVARMSDHQIGRRVDETYYTSIHQSRQEAYAAQKQAKDNGATDEQIQKVGEDTIAASREKWHDETVKDMALRDKAGRLRTFHFIDGKGGAAGAIQKWGQNLITLGRDATMQTYTHGKGDNAKQYTGARGKGLQTLVPRKLQTGPNKGQYVLMPKIAADQLDQHQAYLQQTPASAILQGISGLFRRTVLPYSPKWLANNYTEAALRGAINGVGPLSHHEATSVFKQLGPQQQAEWNQLVKSAGHGGMQRQMLQESTSWQERLNHTKYERLGEALTRYGRNPGTRTMANLHNKWTDLVFGDLNGRMENSLHTAMAGKVLRRHPLMSEKLVELSHKAMLNPDGPKTVEARNNLIALGREVDRMFGKYGKFSPAMRRSIATWTPFIPWSLNAVHFVTQHLPNDHPVVTSLAASAHQASTEWRNKHGLGYFIDGKRPPFLQGAIPGSGDSSWMIFTQGTPFSAFGDPTGTIARGFNPLGSTLLSNLSGRDWKGDPLPNANPYVNLETAILSMLEATTPIGYATQKATGGAGSTTENLKNWANPYHPVKGKQPKGKKSNDLFAPAKKGKSHDPFAGKSKSKSYDPFAP